MVRDSSGTGIAGAQVAVAGTALAAETDDAGRFRLVGVPAGAVTLRVRRLGFAPVTSDVAVAAAGEARVAIEIVELARSLKQVVVLSTTPREYTGYLAGFNERRDQGFGRFITQAQLQKRASMRLSDMLRSVAGVSVLPRGIGDPAVRVRGSRCAPLVWLDGMAAAAGEFDLDALSAESLAGLEIYSGPATTPPQFRLPFGPTACGTIVVWSRHGEAAPQKAISASQLADMVSKLQAFTSEQVDTPVRADSTAPVVPVYPEPMFRQGTPGHVIAEFVVDTTGSAEMETFGIVASTDPAFSESVRRALPAGRYHPAVSGGHLVPQVVRQPFAFVAPIAGDRRRTP